MSRMCYLLPCARSKVASDLVTRRDMTPRLAGMIAAVVLLAFGGSAIAATVDVTGTAGLDGTLGAPGSPGTIGGEGQAGASVDEHIGTNSDDSNQLTLTGGAGGAGGAGGNGLSGTLGGNGGFGGEGGSALGT